MTTLERIRAEIEEQKQVHENESNVDYGVRSGLSIALKIIDKNAEEEPSEDVIALDFSADIDEPNKYQTKDGKWHIDGKWYMGDNVVCHQQVDDVTPTVIADPNNAHIATILHSDEDLVSRKDVIDIIKNLYTTTDEKLCEIRKLPVKSDTCLCGRQGVCKDADS